MTKLASVNFQLLDTKDNGHVLIIDSLPYVNPQNDLQRDANEKKAKQIEREILNQQRMAHYVLEWVKTAKDKNDLPTDDYLLIKKIGEILGSGKAE